MSSRVRSDADDAAEAVSAYRAAVEANGEHRASCATYPSLRCPTGEMLEWNRRRSSAEARVAVKAFGYHSVETYLEANSYVL